MGLLKGARRAAGPEPGSRALSHRESLQSLEFSKWEQSVRAGAGPELSEAPGV